MDSYTNKLRKIVKNKKVVYKKQPKKIQIQKGGERGNESLEYTAE